ncbi:MAG TPA: c-type cytochrome [Rhizomicrobium sp.]|jgi:cytochrome c|nr:c-type cytochrome [Rhizomicrobium sp.]
MRAAPLLVVAALLCTSGTARAGDAARGKITFMQQCSACHTVIANTRDSMGPNLFGVVGRKAGSKPGFVYSDAMKSAGFVWNEAKLAAFVKAPADVVPNSNMFFMGISNPTQAGDVAAYLATLK